MTEIFNEQLVKREPRPIDMIKKVGYLVIAAIIVFISMMSSLLFFFIVIILAAEFFVLRFLFTNMNIEYEYVMTNNELDVDKVIDKRKRKHLFSFDVKSIVAMAKYQEMDKSSEFKNYAKMSDISSGLMKENTYAFIIVADQKRQLVIMEPNEDILKAMRIYMTTRIL